MPHAELARQVAYYDPGAQWVVGDIGDQPYLYRIETLQSFVSKHIGRFKSMREGGFGIGTDIPAAETSREVNYQKIWEDLCNKYDEDWLSLSNWVKEFFAYRQFSWWTTNFPEPTVRLPRYFVGADLTFQHKWMVDLAHHVGIANDWLSNNLLLLRCDCTQIPPQSIRVPSVVDGFCQLIFDPQPQLPQPAHGIAIRLGEPFQHGYTEYAVTHIPVDAITFVPVAISDITLDRINEHARINDSMYVKLIDYLTKGSIPTSI
ncbi:hypothetical protein GCM10027190_45690 [Spirosoma areae]